MSVHTDTAPAVTATPARAGSPEHTRSGTPEAGPRRARSRELEGYRGLAALAIVAFHVCQYALANTTTNPVFSLLTRFEVVDVLFAMSAFLLTLSYARSAIDGDDPQPAGTFLFRRAVRILPLYWVGVVTVWAVRNPTLHADWVDLVEHLTFTQIFDQQRIFYTLGPTWSMSLEIFFYALLVVLGPAAVRLCRRLPSRRQRVRVLLGGCGALFAIPVVWNAVAFFGFHVSYDHWPVYFGPQSRFGAFAVGMALAVFAASRRSEPLFRGVWPSVLRVAALGIVAGRHGAEPRRHVRPGGLPRHRSPRLAAAARQHGARGAGPDVVALALLAAADAGRPDQLQHVHVARAGHDAARPPRADQPVGGRAAVVDPHRPRRLGHRRRDQLPRDRVPHGQAAGAPRAGRPAAGLLPRAGVRREELTR